MDILTALLSLKYQIGRASGREGGRQGHIYASPAKVEAKTSDNMITGTILLFQQATLGLFDLGSTYSYVSVDFAPHLAINLELLEVSLNVSAHIVDSLVANQVCRSCVTTIQGHNTWDNFIMLDMLDLDVILGVDWLSPYYVVLDYYAVTLACLVFP